MESGTLQASLRVLYTVNSNPQYILAKSSSFVPAVICRQNAQSATDQPTYARAPLKACLMAICDSSPELLPDTSRDFSLYVLDPLEPEPPQTGLAQIPQNASPRGVAVALGLMSWALESTDSTNVFVTGTITQSASPSLEVVFALRVTKPMPKPMLHAYPSFSPMSTPGSSQPFHPPQPHQAAGMSWFPTPYMQPTPQGQRTLTRSADFPELYIGPPRRPRGRPEGSTSSKSASKAGTSGASSSKTAADTQSKSRREARKASKQKPKSRPPRAPLPCSPFICTPLARPTTMGTDGSATGATVFCPQSHPSGQSPVHPYPPYSRPLHTPLLELLSAIQSTPGTVPANATIEQQAALLSALQGLLATNSHLPQPTTSTSSNAEQIAETKVTPVESNTKDEYGEGDSDVVLLDPSTVDTTTFRKPSERQFAAGDHDASPLLACQAFAMPSSQNTDASPLPASTPPSGQENTPASSQTLTPIATSEAVTPSFKQRSSEQTAQGTIAGSRALDIPATPTPCRTRKRKLDECDRDQGRSLSPTLPPSPSSPMTRTSSLGRALNGRRRIQSSPTSWPGLVSVPLERLPSMLGAMRATATSTSALAPVPLKVDGLSSGTATDETSLKRKRTLDKFMAEQEARQSAKVRKQSSLGRKSEVAPCAAAGSQPTRPRPTMLAPTSRHTQSSPPRPMFRSDLAGPSFLTSNLPPGFVPVTTSSLPVLSSMTASASVAPSGPTSTAAVPSKNPLKDFVMPAWARTSTAMLPRLSDEALARQRAELETKKAQASQRRREAAKAKRRHLRAEPPSKDSSDDDDDAIVGDGAQRRTMHSIIVSRPLHLPPPPSLPVFASDAVEPLPSSPPHSPSLLPVVPSTPPPKMTASGSGHRTPSKSGSYSLFTPSGQDVGPLFTPSTPSVTRPVTRATFTPRSPTTILHGSGTRGSPRKGVPQTPLWTPKRPHQTPKNIRIGGTPGATVRTPQTQTGMGTRAFLLPPPSPCALRASARVMVAGDARITTQPPHEQDLERSQDESSTGHKQGGTFIGEGVSSPLEYADSSPNQDQNESGLRTPTRLPQAGDIDAYPLSPLPPSSPLPTSPLSSPAKPNDSQVSSPMNDPLAVPDSDVPLPSDGPAVDNVTAWLPDTWFSDAEASAWLTESEAWLTDTEGAGTGAPLTDSDAAWFSDSDAMFGDISSLPPLSASNWVSDDADMDTDVDVDRHGGFDPTEFERTFAALVEQQAQMGKDKDGNDLSQGASELWAALEPWLGGVVEAGATTGNVVGGSQVDGEEKAAGAIQELLDDLA